MHLTYAAKRCLRSHDHYFYWLLACRDGCQSAGPITLMQTWISEQTALITVFQQTLPLGGVHKLVMPQAGTAWIMATCKTQTCISQRPPSEMASLQFSDLAPTYPMATLHEA